MKRASLYDANLAVSRELDSSYDLVKRVAENIDLITQVNDELQAGTFDNIINVLAEPLRTNINLLGPISASISTVAQRAVDIQAVAANEADISSVAANLVEIQEVVQYVDAINEVGGAISYITTAANNISNIVTVADNTGNVNNVSGNIEEVVAVGSNIDALITANENITTIAAVGDNINDIITVSDNITNVNAVGTISSDVTAVANNNVDVSTVAGSIDSVNTVAASDAEVVAVGTDLLLPTPNISVVAANILDVSTVSSNIADVSTVAGISSDVSTVAGVASDVTSVVTNIVPDLPEILQADTRAEEALQSQYEATAAKMTADSYAVEPENTHVKSYTSNGDGTYTATDTGDYSALHWAAKSEASATLDDIVADSLRLAGGVGDQGVLSWNIADETVDAVLDTDVILQLGQELLVRGKNNTGSTITNGTVLMFTGAVGASGVIEIGPHNGTKADGYKIAGIATQEIVDGDIGFSLLRGKIRGLNTTGAAVGETWNEGDALYVSPSGNGELTNIEPQPNELKMLVGVVVNVHASSGAIQVRTSGIDENITADEVYLDNTGTNLVGTTSQDTIVELDGRLDTAETKLSGIESGATADQTATEILTAIKTVDGAGSGLDADTVDGVEASNLAKLDTTNTFIGQQIVSGNMVVYGGNWLRNTNSGYGLYNDANGNHIYSDSANYWAMTYSGASGGLAVRNGYDGTAVGYLYGDANKFGLLNQGSWAVKTESGVGTEISKGLSVNNSGDTNPLPIILVPQGGSSKHPSSTHTGYIQIKLPILYVGTMISFEVSVFNYLTNKTVKFLISGYNYAGSSSWVNCSAIQMGNHTTKYNVRFGDDGTNSCIWIGESTTVWKYPQVNVTNVKVGYITSYFDTLKSGWEVNYVTSTDTVTTTVQAGLDASTLEGLNSENILTNVSEFGVGRVLLCMALEYVPPLQTVSGADLAPLLSSPNGFPQYDEMTDQPAIPGMWKNIHPNIAINEYHYNSNSTCIGYFKRIL